MPLFVCTLSDKEIASLAYAREGTGAHKGQHHIRVKVHGNPYYFRSGIPVDVPSTSYGRFGRRLALIPDANIIRELTPGNPDDEQILMDWRVKELGLKMPEAKEVVVEKEVEVAKFYLPPKSILAKCTKPSLVEMAGELGIDTEDKTTATLLADIESKRAA